MWLAAITVAGCTLDNPAESAPSVSVEFFACAVQPVLARECSFPACHGSPERRFQVLSPGRMRIATEYGIARTQISADDAEAGIHPPLTAVELDFNVQQALGFAVAAGDVEKSQLLKRPLALGAGGTYHGIGGDVFPSAQSPGYETLARWLSGAGAGECP